MKFAPTLLVSFLFLFFLACEPSSSSNSSYQEGEAQKDTNTIGNTNKQPAKKTVPVNKKPDLGDLEKVGQTMSTTKFNEEIATARESGKEWTGSPITVALKFAGEGLDSRKKSIDIESLSGGEVFNKVVVSITEDGFLDDSIRGAMVILRMEENNGFWSITSAKKVWRCWENRGHTAYNSDPCN